MSDATTASPEMDGMREQAGNFEVGLGGSGKRGNTPDKAAAKGRRVSRLELFLRSSLFDYVLVLVASVALVFTVSYGFESAPDLRGNILLDTLLCAIPLLLMFAGAWSKKALPLSIVATAAYAVAVVGAAIALTPADTPLFVEGAINDVANNYAVFAFVVVVVPILAYLLSRRPFGALLLFVASTFACAFVQYLYRDWVVGGSGIVAFVVVVVSTLALIMYQRYRSSIYKVAKLDGTAFGAVTAFAVATGTVCVVVGIALYYLIIAPLGLGSVEIKPFEDTYARPVVYYTGVYETQDVNDPNLVSGYISDDERLTRNNSKGGLSEEEDQYSEKQDSQQDSEQDSQQDSQSDNQQNNGNQGNEQNDAQDDQQSSAERQSPMATFVAGMTSFDSDSWNEQFRTINYKEFSLWALMILVVIAAIVALIIFIQRRRRKLRIDRLEKKTPSYAVWWLYDFLTGRFERIGFTRPAHLTLLEYALSNRQNMKQFERGTGGVDWLECTLAYQRACLAEGEATKADFDTLRRYYEAFYRNAFKYVGPRRWLWLFWRL